MKYEYVVLGAGRQGQAIAYDCIKNGEARSVKIADEILEFAKQGADRINRLTKSKAATAHQVNAKNLNAVSSLIRGSNAVVSALPYFLNLKIAEIAISQNAHFTDLGGNTQIVMEELKLHSTAKKNGVSCAPDCGLAPGLSNLLAAYAIEKLGGQADEIHVRCGGLPQKPKPPFGYKLVFSLHGLINEYSGDAIVLKNGKISTALALSEPEMVQIPKIGKLEAAVTTGGTSTAPYSFKGKVKNFDYKTLRYPGHFDAFRAFSNLGMFAPEQRSDFIKLLEPKIRFDADKDLVILQVVAFRKVGAKIKKYKALLIDKGDLKTGFTAMERTTGFPTAVIAHLQAQGKMPAGAIPIEKSVPLDLFMKALIKRGIKISELK